MKSKKSTHRIAIENLLLETKRHLSRDEIAQMCNVTKRQVISVLQAMRDYSTPGGVLDSFQDPAGLGHLYRVMPAETKPNRIQPVRPGTTSGNYMGAELQPYSGRPGAMDAFELPSVVNGERVPRIAPRLLCVGKAGPAAVQAAGQPRFSK